MLVEREGCAHEDNDNEVALAHGMNMTVLNRISLDDIDFSHLEVKPSLSVATPCRLPSNASEWCI